MISAKLEGLDRLQRAFAELSKRPVDFTRVEGSAHQALSGVVQRNFDTRGGLVGGWSPRKRSAEPATHPLMQQTGGLLHSFVRRGAEGSVFDVTPTSIVYGSSLPRATAHQRGVPRRGLLARPVLPSPEAFAEAVSRVVRVDAVRFTTRLGFVVKG